MTTNTPAPAMQEALLTDTEMITCFKDAIQRAHAQGLADAGPHEYVAAGAYALLSKLRAPVADERVGPRHPVVIKWRNNGIEACAGIADAYGIDQAAADMRAMLTKEKGNESSASLGGCPSSNQSCDERSVDRSVRDGSVFGVTHLENALREMIEVAERVDGWQSFPIDPIERARAALASAPVAGEARLHLAPLKCPITGRPFFMAIEHPELGMVPTYGGPYDSYTIPHLGGKPDQPWHERELRVYRYDHDLGGWRTDEVEVIPLRIVHEDVLHGLEEAAPQASEAVRDAGMAASEDVDDKAYAQRLREAAYWDRRKGAYTSVRRNDLMSLLRAAGMDRFTGGEQ